MKLIELLEALSGNTNLNISLLDSNGKNMITFGAPGYMAVESDLGERVVNRIKVSSSSAISITIEDAT